MGEWKKYKLSDIADIIAGYAFKSKEFGRVGVSVVKIKDINPLYVDICNTDKVDISVYPKEKMDKYKIENGDYVIAMTGATIGKVGRVRCDEIAYINQRVAKIKAKQGVDNDFVYYAISGNNFQQFIQNNIDSNSAQENISATSIGKFPISLPPMEEQKRIAGILSALDDKIELNRRINSNLELQAQTLFNHWFVENTKNGVLADMIENSLSGDWGKDEPTDKYTSEVYCIRGADIPDIKLGNKGKMPVRYILEKNCNNKKLSANDMVVEISGGSPTQSTGRVCLITQSLLDRLGKDTICTNFCRAITPKQGYAIYIYLYWQHLYNNNTMFSYENGTTGIKNLDIADFITKEPVFVPTREAVNKLNETLAPIYDAISANGSENEKLSQLRDTLLPKLMNGEII